MQLAPDQLRQYETDGYLFIEGLFTAEETDLLREHAFSAAMARSQGVKVEEGTSVIRMLRGIHREDPLFDRLTRHPRLLDPSRQLAREDVYLYQTRVVVKAGFEGKPFTMYPWHQDFSTWYLMDRMVEPKPIVIGVFLDEINACNAPLMVVPRSHAHGLLARSTTNPDPLGTGQIVMDAAMMRSLVADGGVRALTGPPGSTFFMHANLVHASNENITPLRRAILYVVYNPLSNRCQSQRASYFAPPSFETLSALGDDCLFESTMVNA
jgi:L-proline 4-hydroxylase